MVVQPTPPLPPTTATDLPRVDRVATERETRCSATSRSAITIGSGSHSVMPRRIASSMPVGSSEWARTTMPALGNCRFRVARSRGRVPSPRVSTTKASGPCDPGTCRLATSAIGGVVDPEAPAAQRGQQFGVGRIEEGDRRATRLSHQEAC